MKWRCIILEKCLHITKHFVSKMPISSPRSVLFQSSWTWIGILRSLLTLQSLNIIPLVPTCTPQCKVPALLSLGTGLPNPKAKTRVQKTHNPSPVQNPRFESKIHKPIWSPNIWSQHSPESRKPSWRRSVHMAEEWVVVTNNPPCSTHLAK